MKETKKFIFSPNFSKSVKSVIYLQLSDCKFVAKGTSQILLWTPWHPMKAQGTRLPM